MKITYTTKQVTMTDEMQTYAEKKVSKLEKYFKGEPEAVVTFARERDRMTAEVTVKCDGRLFRANQTTKDMYVSVNSAVNAIERQIHKNKTRLSKSLREGAFDAVPAAESEEKDDSLMEVEVEDEYVVVRKKQFRMKPMSVEEAILEMNLLNHEFFVFRNQDDGDNFAVVYRRNNGGYGVIEPEE